MNPDLTSENLLSIVKNLKEAYPTSEDLIRDLDALMYMLFYIEPDHFSNNEIRNSAFLLKTLKRILESDCV